MCRTKAWDREAARSSPATCRSRSRATPRSPRSPRPARCACSPTPTAGARRRSPTCRRSTSSASPASTWRRSSARWCPPARRARSSPSSTPASMPRSIRAMCTTRWSASALACARARPRSSTPRCAPNTRSTQNSSSSPVRSSISNAALPSPPRRRGPRFLFKQVFLLALAMALPAFAQDPAAGYPKKPIRVVIGYAAGGGSDVVPRLVLERVSAKWGQPFLVENRPGASGHIATEIVAKAAPDGYTLLSVPAAFATTPHMFASLPFDPDAMVPVTVFVSQANLLVSHPGRMPDVHTFQDLVAAAKARPGALNYGSAGNGGSQHLSMELLKMLAGGLQITHVPYKGGAVVTGMIAGDVDCGFYTIGGLLPHIKSGRLRALAVGGAQRKPALPG